MSAANGEDAVPEDVTVALPADSNRAHYRAQRVGEDAAGLTLDEAVEALRDIASHGWNDRQGRARRALGLHDDCENSPIEPLRENRRRPARLSDLPNGVANALLVPVYDLLSEDEALDGVADEVVQQQLDMLSRVDPETALFGRTERLS